MKINELTTALNDLELDWAKRNAWLENLYDSQAFMRDARYLDRLSTSQEVIYNHLQSLTYPCISCHIHLILIIYYYNKFNNLNIFPGISEKYRIW